MRKAFTLIELLVVLFILGMLVALLLPAVQMVRESARKARCVNRQRNLAIAMHNYESAQGKLPGWRDFITVAPPIGIPLPQNVLDSGEVAAHASWVFSILPHMEEVDLFDRLKTGQVRFGTEIPSPAILNCPSHIEGPAHRMTNYTVNVGAVDDFSNQDTHTDLNEGVINGVSTDGNVANGPFLDKAWIATGNVAPKFRYAAARFGDISKMDGTTNTLMISENVQRGFWISTSITHFYHNTAGTVLPHVAADYVPLPDGRYSLPLTGGVRDFAEGSVGFCWPRFYYDGEIPPQTPPAGYNYPPICYLRNDADPNNPGFTRDQPPGNDPLSGPFVSIDRDPYDQDRIPVYLNAFRRKTFTSWYHSARPSSNHPSSVVAAFCDGNVRSLNEDISERVFVQIMVAGAMQSDAGKRILVPGNPPNFIEGMLFDPRSID